MADFLFQKEGDKMPYIPFTDEQKEQANSTDLVSFLQMKGETLKCVGREYQLIYSDESGKHDSITISGSKWYDHKNQDGGGAVKFMQKFYGMNFPDAVQELLGYTVMPEYSRKYERSPPEQPEIKKEFQLPERNQDMHRVYAYLVKSRFISPEIINYFAHQHTLYEDAQYHNAVFVGLDENGIPRQAHKRSTNTYKTFKMTCTGSDTRYSFSHFGKSGRLFVFEAPIDMLSFLTLYPKNWQEHSYIATNGVYEKALLHSLETHSNLQEIIICTDNDEGGIDGAYRFRDILHQHGYQNIRRFAPQMKDFNEVLKAQRGIEALPAVPHKRLECYKNSVDSMAEYPFSPENLTQAMQKKEYLHLAELALAGSAFFLRNSGYQANFQVLQNKLKVQYRAYSDKGSRLSKWQNLNRAFQKSLQNLHHQVDAVQTAKSLFELADFAVKLDTEEALAQEQTQEPEEDFSQAYG